MHQWTIQYRTNVYECLSPGLRIGSTVNSMQLCKVSLRFASTLSCMSSNCNLKWICHFAFIWNPLQMVSYQLLTTSAVHWNVKLAFDDDGTPGVMEWLSAFHPCGLRYASVFIWVPKLCESKSGQMVSRYRYIGKSEKRYRYIGKSETSIIWYIYLTKMWNLTKKLMKQLKRPISEKNQFFPIFSVRSEK